MSKTKQKNTSPWVIKDLDLYEGISEAMLCQIAPNSFEEKFSKGTQIYSPHQEDAKIYVVQQGEVILYHAKKGKRAIFDVLPPGSVFGSFDPEMTTPTHFAETTKGTLLCVTPLNEFLKIVEHQPQMMLRFMQKMVQRIRDYEIKIKSNIETASEKVYSELERLQKKRNDGFFGRFIPLQVTHEKLAEYTNLNRVTVTRCIQKLKKEGLIHVNEKGVIEIVK